MALHAVITRVAIGAVPAAAKPYLFGALLTPLTKDGGGIRPIAVGDLLVRVAGRALASDHAEGFGAFFKMANQFGVACSSGSDVVVHGVSLAMSAHEDWITLQLDIRNAFNSVSRHLILAQLQRHFPTLVPYFMARYGASTQLQVLGSGHDPPATILSREGVQQGDPLGPAFFAIALEAVTRGVLYLDAPPPDADPGRAGFLPFFAPIFVDDIHLCGPPALVGDVCLRLARRAAELRSGLVFNASKSTLYSPHVRPTTVLATMPLSHRDLVDFMAFRLASAVDGIVVLGTPLGTHTSIGMRLEEQMDKLRASVFLLPKLQSMQIRILLLRLCVPQALNHITRTTPTPLCENATTFLDHIMLRGLSAAQEFDSTELEWQRLVRLPLRLGGMGLTSATEVAPLAYLASVAATLRHRDLPALAALRADIEQWTRAPADDHTTPPHFRYLHHSLAYVNNRITAHRAVHPNFAVTMAGNPTLLPQTAVDLLTLQPKLQQRLSRLWAEANSDVLRDSASVPFRARMLSQRQRGSTHPLEAIPSCEALTMPNDTCQLFLKNYQAIPEIAPASYRCHCLSGAADHPHGHLVDTTHDERCHLGNGFTLRHNSLVRELSNMFREAGFEVLLQHHYQGPVESPDMLVSNFPGNNMTSAIEVSTISIMQEREVRQAAQVGLSSASHKEKQKFEKYLAYVTSTGFSLFPAIWETTGAQGKVTQHILATVKCLSPRELFDESAADRTWASSTFLRFWGQRLAIAFWNGAASMAKQVASHRRGPTPAAPPRSL